MAIAPSKLGQLIAEAWESEERLIHGLRENGLVDKDATDDTLLAAIKMAKEEDAALNSGQRPFNSPNERARVFLGPYLTRKGRKWAVPLSSLESRRWWEFWG